MKGFFRLKATDFDAWNEAATVKANENGLSCDTYTTCIPDIDGVHTYARVEHDYITKEPLLSYEDAILSGMNIN